MPTRFIQFFLFLFSVCTTFLSQNVFSENLPFGSSDEIAYAARLWDKMAAEKLVGPDAKPLEPFFGGAKPHGTILEMADLHLELDHHQGKLVVKKNYSQPGATVSLVKQNRSEYLSSYTIMYQREAGYDPQNQNWFWVKYQPDGSLFLKSISGNSMQMAGRIVKGRRPEDTQGGCLYCHASAGGGDYIFYPEITNDKAKPNR